MRPDFDSALDLAVHDFERDVVDGSLEVVREKHVGDDVVVAVTYRRHDKAGVRRACLGVAWSAKYGWHSAGGAWASTIIDRPPRGIWLDWGGWGPGPHVKSGWLADPAARSLRVTDPLGRVLEDEVENGVAILVWHEDLHVERATAELRDAEGQLLTREPLEPRRR